MHHARTARQSGAREDAATISIFSRYPIDQSDARLKRVSGPVASHQGGIGRADERHYVGNGMRLGFWNEY
jgi:hypothetical protein